MNPITLYQAPTRPWSSPNLSPFCVKLECYLRMVELPHTIAPMNRGKAPKGKIPYVDLGDGRLLGDSQLIIEHLEKALVAAGKPSLDAGLSTTEAATSQLLRRTLEEGTYFAGMYLRWATDDGYVVVKEEFKKFVPGLVLPIIRRDIKKRLVGQGSGRHTRAEIEAMAAADFDAVADLLGDKPFMFGDRPHVADCVVFAFLEAVLGFPNASEVSKRIVARPNLVALRARIRERWWKDLPLPA